MQYYGGSEIKNTAVFSHDGMDQNIPGSFKIKAPDYISKNGQYNGATGRIDWTVNFNNDALSLHSVHITDILTNGQALDKTSVRLDGEMVSEGSGEGTFSFDEGSGLLDYNAGDITKAHALTFSTILPSGYWQHNHAAGEFSNTAKITADDNAYIKDGVPAEKTGVGPANSVISKSGTKYDYDTHRITWQIIVNAGKNDLPHAYLTDTIPKGQRYVPESFKITDGAPENGSYGYAFSGTLPDDPSASETVLTYDFSAIKDTYTITYQTEITDPTKWASNQSVSYKNKVSLSANADTTHSDAEPAYPVTINVISKSGVKYDYVNHELLWKIVINSSKIPLTNAIVSDTLTGNGLDDFALDTSSIRIDNVQAYPDTGNPPADGKYYYDETTKTLVFDFQDLSGADRMKTITFSMKLNKTGGEYDEYFAANGERTITNKAQLVSDQNKTPTWSDASQKIDNQLVGKTGYYKSGMAYIDWAVNINQNGIKLDDLKLTDVLQQGLELDTSSVKLYKQTLNPDGSYTPSQVYDDSTGDLNVSGTSLTLTKDNISYDAATRTFVFTMPNPVEGPYLLTFRTTVDAAYSNAKFTNTISFNGGKEGQDSSSGEIPVGFSAVDSKAWGETANVPVAKADGASGANLPGATFGLYDGFGNLVRVSDPTDASGKTVFTHIKYSVPYTVKELTPPANYELGYGSYSFRVENGGKLQMLDSSLNPQGDPVSVIPAFSDDRKVADVRMTKTGDGGRPLKGASFSLCDADGAPVAGYPTVTSDDAGEVAFADVPYGSYKIVETNAPEGYFKITVPFVLDDTNTGIVTYGADHSLNLGSYKDEPSGSITVNKSASDYQGGASSPLADAGFAVIDSVTGSVVCGTKKTDRSGKVKFADLPVGSYTLIETSAPSDYSAVADYEFTISADDSAAERQLTVNLTDVKESGRIKFIKTDGENPLPGAEFSLYDSTGEKRISNANGYITAVSDADGIVQFDDVPYGEYLIKETKAPVDYDLMKNPITGVSIHSPEVQLQSVSNSRLIGSMSFTKIGEDSGLLPGAEFTLYSQDGTAVGEPQVSDQRGKVTFAGVPAGNGYVIRETKAPHGYAVHDDIVVDLHSASYDCGKVVDKLLRGAVRVHKTDTDGKALSGAEFTLYDGSGKALAKSVSDKSGAAVFKGVPFGDYSVAETKAPQGYRIDDSRHKISVDSVDEVAEISVTDEKLPAILPPVNPKTGDMFHTGLMIALAVGSFGVLIADAVYIKRRPGKEKH